jgi:hypothetical protein
MLIIFSNIIYTIRLNSTNDFSKTMYQKNYLKGIVSRDWGRLQMGSLDRSEFPTIPLEVYF